MFATPPSILIPASTPPHPSSSSNSAQQTKEVYRHFITEREFGEWSQSHPVDSGRIRPTLTGEVEGKKGYRAPQHPASHVLQSIPPRAPSRSTRSNILSYTLHLSTSSRLASYTSPNGSGTLLQRAETRDWIDIIDENWSEDELKCKGLWKVGVNLLRGALSEAELPPSVERRVGLGRLVEEMLLFPEAALAINPVSASQVRDSSTVDAVKALEPLTSPDNTVLYSSGAVGEASNSTKSVAQSLIEMKFGGMVDGGASSFPDSTKPTPPSALDPLPSTGASSSSPSSSFDPIPNDSSRQSETVFASTSNLSTARSELTAAPHMDYRIVRTQAMRSKAKETFSTSILPTTSSIWCRRHRVCDCKVCEMVMSTLLLGVEDEKLQGGRRSRMKVAGQGLVSLGPGSKKALIELVPSFIIFSASLLKDLRERQAGYDHEERQYMVQVAPSEDINTTASWYSLLHSLVIQACLEGYLVEGWTGTKAIETLFGCGCGVWEGRGWASRVALSNVSISNLVKSNLGYESAHDSMDVDSEGSSSSSRSSSSGSEGSDMESETDEEERKEVGRESAKNALIEAAHALFGSRDAHQADFEKSMRDRVQEFLDIPASSTLEAHLMRLNAKYPLSTFENEMVDFLESTSRLLGKPALAKYETTSTTTPAGQIPDSDPDPYALVRYFSRTESSETTTPSATTTTSSTAAGKRRRTE